MTNVKADYDCYLDALTRSQNRPCDFLDDPDKTFINVQYNKKIDFIKTELKNMDSPQQLNNIYFIIDNTKFPENGANYKNPFQIEVLYYIDFQPSDGFYLKAILCIIFLLQFILIFLYSQKNLKNSGDCIWNNFRFFV